jgi:exopolysaccharide biosynthesis polyprenyl glycosylphosphotransferase
MSSSPVKTAGALPLAEYEIVGLRKTSVFSKRWVMSLVIAFLDISGWLVVFRLMMEFRHAAEQTTPGAWLTACLLGLFTTMGALYVIGGYNPRRDMKKLSFAAEFILAVAGAIALGLVLIYGMATYNAEMKPSRGVLLSTFMIFPVLSLFWRRSIAAWYGSLNKTREFLVVGAGDLAKEFLKAYERSGSSQKLRFVSDAADVVDGPISGEGSPVVEKNVLQQIQRINHQVAGIVLAEEPGHISLTLTEALVRLHFERVPVYTLESFYEHFWQKVPVMALDSEWPLQSGFPLSTDTAYGSFKRLADIIFASVALVALSPLMGLIALIVRLESQGPVLFKQERVGWHRTSFLVWKFRTMYIREVEGSLYTQAKDSRITRSGRWLRKLRLDELPQLWNVLVGDMSLIGPRAEWVRLVEQYQDFIPSYHFRHLVKPGITGWAQVNYPYGANLDDTIQKLKYDLYYIRHYSLKLDAMIVLKTIHVIFMAKGK